MPTYDYACTCGREPWCEMHKIDDRHTEVCTCGLPAKLQIGTPELATFSMRDADGQKKELKRRSFQHTQKELKNHGIPQFNKKTRKYQ